MHSIQIKGAKDEPQKYLKKYKRFGVLLASILLLGLIVVVFRKVLASTHISSSGDSRVLNSAQESSEVIDPSTYMKTISWSPRIFSFSNFLTHEECDKLIAEAKARLKQSGLYDGKGNFEDANTRSSNDMFFGADETLWLDERIARSTRLPMSHGEATTVIHYGPTQQYLPHFDYFAFGVDDQTDQMLNQYGNRVATFIMYLNDMPEDAGGETAFPDADGGPVSIRPKKGDAAFFYNKRPDGKVDPKSLHTGKPVKYGEKWIAVKWIREKKWKYTEDWVPTFGTAAADIAKLEAQSK